MALGIAVGPSQGSSGTFASVTLNGCTAGLTVGILCINDTPGFTAPTCSGETCTLVGKPWTVQWGGTSPYAQYAQCNLTSSGNKTFTLAGGSTPDGTVIIAWEFNAAAVFDTVADGYWGRSHPNSVNLQNNITTGGPNAFIWSFAVGPDDTAASPTGWTHFATNDALFTCDSAYLLDAGSAGQIQIPWRFGSAGTPPFKFGCFSASWLPAAGSAPPAIDVDTKLSNSITPSGNNLEIGFIFPTANKFTILTADIHLSALPAGSTAFSVTGNNMTWRRVAERSYSTGTGARVVAVFAALNGASPTQAEGPVIAKSDSATYTGDSIVHIIECTGVDTTTPMPGWTSPSSDSAQNSTSGATSLSALSIPGSPTGSDITVAVFGSNNTVNDFSISPSSWSALTASLNADVQQWVYINFAKDTGPSWSWSTASVSAGAIGFVIKAAPPSGSAAGAGSGTGSGAGASAATAASVGAGNGIGSGAGTGRGVASGATIAAWYDPEFVPNAWFDPEINQSGWFDRETTATVQTGVANGAGSGTSSGAATSAVLAAADGAGSATGSGTGVGASNAASAGAGSGVGQGTAVGNANFVAAGAGSGTGSGAATGSSIANSAGAGNGIGSGAAAGQSTAASAGAGSGTGSGAAISAAAVGTGSGSGTGSGTAISAAIAAATGAGSATGSGAATSNANFAATGAGSGTGSGAATGASTAASAGSGSGTGSGAAVSAAGVGTGAGSGTGSGTGVGASIAAAAGAGNATGSGAATSALGSAGAGSGTGSGAATGQSLAAAAGAGSGVGAGTGVGNANVAATGAGSGKGTGAAVGVGGGVGVGAGSARGTGAAISSIIAGSVGSGQGIGSGAGVGHQIGTSTQRYPTSGVGRQGVGDKRPDQEAEIRPAQLSTGKRAA